MTKILVPIDFSDTSKNALFYAANLFNRDSLEITILHIYGATSSTLMFKSIDGILLQDAEDQMAILLKDLKEKFPKIVFNVKLKKNYAVSTIANMGDSGGFDFIVMGTKGVSGMKEVFMGSVAGGVVAKTSTPVIVVPLDYKFDRLQKIVFAVGNKPIPKETLSGTLRKLMERHQAQLMLLHIAEEEPINEEEILSPFKEFDPTFKYQKSTGNIYQLINDFTEKVTPGLLCLLRRKKSIIEKTFKESVTKKHTFNSNIPLLILHE